MAQSTLNQHAKAILAQPVFVHLAVVQSDGTPHSTPVWVDIEGDDVIVNTALGRSKARSIHKDSIVALSLLDPKNPYQAIAFQGRVIDVTEEGADAHIDFLAKKYLGVETYPNRQPGERRIKIVIRPEKIWMQPSEG